MKITIESTSRLTTVDGVECRAWTGTTEAGTPCVVFVRRIAVEMGKHAEFERELLEKATPEELQGARAIPLREIL